MLQTDKKGYQNAKQYSLPTRSLYCLLVVKLWPYQPFTHPNKCCTLLCHGGPAGSHAPCCEAQLQMPSEEPSRTFMQKSTASWIRDEHSTRGAAPMKRHRPLLYTGTLMAVALEPSPGEHASRAPEPFSPGWYLMSWR